MNDHLNELFAKSPLFFTERVLVKPWQVIEDSYASKQNLIQELKELLSPIVIKDLPDSWQELIGGDQMGTWLEEQKRESHLYAILNRNNEELIGLLFLYLENEEVAEEKIELRLGYLLKESVWGKGVASELIAALMLWCGRLSIVKSISGGVEEGNMGSIKVLEKNGFKKSSQEMPPGVLLYTFEF